jgi:hypothetical protein
MKYGEGKRAITFGVINQEYDELKEVYKRNKKYRKDHGLPKKTLNDGWIREAIVWLIKTIRKENVDGPQKTE